jgi:5-methylcytosine-specific restriction enzyme A
MTKRRNFSKATIVERFKFCAGRCEKCGVVLKPGGYHCDHDNPDGLTGEPTFENARILCHPCHAEKTKDDVARIAKAKRIEARHVGATRPTGKLQGRGFAKAEKRPRIEKNTLPPKRMYEDAV